jgi:hypothetical protein
MIQMRQSACTDSFVRSSVIYETNSCGTSPEMHMHDSITASSNLDPRLVGERVRGNNQTCITDDDLDVDGAMCPVLERSSVTGKYDGAGVADSLSNSISEPSSSQHDSVVTAINVYANNILEVNCNPDKRCDETAVQQVSFHLENTVGNNSIEAAVCNNHCSRELDDVAKLGQADGKLVASSLKLQ